MKKITLLLCVLPSLVFAEQLTDQQVVELRQQMNICNSDPQPMYGICAQTYEKLKQHYGSYQAYRTAMSAAQK
jgi:hypothetical protein